MYRIIILLLISIRCINCTFSQNDLNSKLLSLELCAYNSENDTIKNKYIVEKVELYLNNNFQSLTVLNEIKRINFSFIEDSIIKSNLLWNSTLISYFNDDIYYSLYYLDQYEILSNDSTIEKHILKTLIYSKYNSKVSTEIIDKLSLIDSNLSCLDCLSKINILELKHEKYSKKCSYVLPGLGMCLNGEMVKGTTSLLLNSITFLSVRWLFMNQLYINMFAWGSNLFVKFYIGNLKLTQKIIDNKKNGYRSKKANECSISISSILDRYPLRFKFN